MRGRGTVTSQDGADISPPRAVHATIGCNARSVTVESPLLPTVIFPQRLTTTFHELDFNAPLDIDFYVVDASIGINPGFPF